MTGLLEQLRSWIEYLIAALGYGGIALVMALESVFPPIPSELVMPFAGFLVACQTTPEISKACEGAQFSLWGVTAAGTVGAVAGALVLYYLGYWTGEARLRPFVQRFGRWFFFSEADLDTSLAYFDRHGKPAVFFGRLVPLIRSLISLPAGLRRMHLPTFLVMTTLGSALWSGGLAFLGLTLGNRWEEVIGWLARYQNIVFVLFGLAISFWLFRKLNLKK